MILKFALFDSLNTKAQENYNGIIARWYKSEWGKFRPDKSQLQDWKIKPSSLASFPMTFLTLDEACNPSNLLGVVRLKYDDVEGLFPNQNHYRLSGLYVEPHYRKQSLGAKLIQTALKKAEKEKAVNNYQITNCQNIFGNVYGDNLNQNFSISPGNTSELQTFLKKNGLEQTQISQLLAAIEADPKPTQSNKIGQNVANWLGKIVWEGITNITTDLIVKAIQHYYGNF